ncbi:MAG: helix-turn-helix transcriptional regulator [Anaerolineales bacterium]|nr:helix-turn-helix transcriptional regulator [Anaerolineales bacterium]MCW5855320.1 helix-turn-helix transcriptional regulator [Anaerolineales bacterium]
MAYGQQAKAALVEWAEANGVTPAEFREKTGCSYMHAWKLLRGNKFPTKDTVARLLAAYGPAPAQLVSDALQGVGPAVQQKP